MPRTVKYVLSVDLCGFLWTEKGLIEKPRGPLPTPRATSAAERRSPHGPTAKPPGALPSWPNSHGARRGSLLSGDADARADAGGGGVRGGGGGS